MAEFEPGKGLLELASVQRAFSEATEYAGSVFARRLYGGLHYALSCPMHIREPVASPIEAIFLAWFAAVESLMDRDVCSAVLEPQTVVTLTNGTVYRLDFSLTVGDQHFVNRCHALGLTEHMPKIAIELDGHDYHEKTKEQVAYRNQRDRDLQAAGWTVLHFSGSEIHRDPLKCATSALAFARDRYLDFIISHKDPATAPEV